jgi:predicted Rdx family selenoprotein
VRDALGRIGITDVTIEPGSTGQFDVLIDGKLKYSRAKTGRFPSDADIATLTT